MIYYGGSLTCSSLPHLFHFGTHQPPNLASATAGVHRLTRLVFPSGVKRESGPTPTGCLAIASKAHNRADSQSKREREPHGIAFTVLSLALPQCTGFGVGTLTRKGTRCRASVRGCVSAVPLTSEILPLAHTPSAIDFLKRINSTLCNSQRTRAIRLPWHRVMLGGSVPCGHHTRG